LNERHVSRGARNDCVQATSSWLKPRREKEVESTIDVDVVEESGDVEEKERARSPGLNARLGVVDHAECGIDGAVVVAAAELVGVEEEGRCWTRP
jgi:hypothetical protein